MATGLALARLRELLHYDPETGAFTWKIYVCGRAPAGAVAGTTYRNGYHYIWLDGQRYFAHRLAWFYVHERWPVHEIDHIDCCRSNNAIANLREATESQNHFRVQSKSAQRGVYRVHTGRWRAKIGVRGRDLHLGYFPTADEAAAAYKVAAHHYFGAFAEGIV